MKHWRTLFKKTYGIATNDHYKRMYEAILYGDPKNRVLRILWNTIFLDYKASFDDEAKGGVVHDRDALKIAIERALYGADALMTLLNLAPLGAYEVEFNFGDITYNYEEDKANWKSYAAQGWIPKWMYFVKFEGMSEEEAKALTQEADKENQAKDAGNLFPRAE